MRAFVGCVLSGLLAVAAVGGCGPNLSEEDLGTVVTDMSEVPGADEPYELPELEEPPPADSEPAPIETGP